MNRIFITGDTHGEIVENMEIKKLSKKNWLKKNGDYPGKGDFVIIAGDFGLIFNNVQSEPEKWWLKWLEEKPFTTLFVDGNHENHVKLQELEQIHKFKGIVGKVNSKVFHLRRGEIYTIADKRIFTMGGAMSIDKEQRMIDISWWEAELPNDKEMNYALENLEKKLNWVDYIISHTCPQIIADVYLRKRGYPKINDKLGDPLGCFFDYIVNTIDFKDWYFGHWHDDWDYGKYHMIYNNVIEIK